MSSDLSENQRPPAGRTNAVLALGRRMAEQYHRDNGSYQFAVLAAPEHCKEAMREAANEDHYYAKCHALGVSADNAKAVLDGVIALADKQGLPMDVMWERAWHRAIETSMQ